MRTMRDRFRASFLGIAVGDAMGMPVEMMTAEEIARATDGKGVTGFIDPLQTKIKGTRSLPPGTTTDDTQLTLAVARSLIECRRFDMTDQARKLVQAWADTKFGWGRATKGAAEEIGQWFLSDGQKGRHPEAPAPAPSTDGEGCGNGVAMKVAPLALRHAAVHGSDKDEPLLSEVMELGLMTHGDPRASIAAAALAKAYVLCASGAAATLAGVGIIDRVTDTALILESRYRFYRANEDTFSSALLWAKKCLGSAAVLRNQVGTACFALESVAFAIGTFCRHPADFRAGVLEAVNAGGDADTTASMVGGLIGANLGLACVPKEWSDGLLGLPHILRTADELADSIGLP
jgi:ADP-ribosyl-[dinitrogen reductase] hydrolase